MSEGFSFKKDFKSIDWKSTVQVNLIRGFFAGIVWSIFMFFYAKMGAMAFMYIIIWPLFAWIVIYPFIRIVAWLSDMGVPFIGFMVPILALMMAVGDPFTFILHKYSPELVPVKKYKFFDLTAIIFVVDNQEDSVPLSEDDLIRKKLMN